MDKKKEIVYFFKKLYETGDITLFEGNISCRNQGTFFITPSQQSKESLTEEMIVEIGSSGEIIDANGYVPSSEYRMHLALYALREDICAIVHTHSAFATAFALRGSPIKNGLAELSLFFNGEIPCCSYGEPGSDAVFKDFKKYFSEEKKDVALLERHGLVAGGKSVEDAFAKAQTAEKIAKISLLSRLL